MTQTSTAASTRQKISVVIPLVDEEPSLHTLYGELITVCATTGSPFEIIFVDDGSKDGSWRSLSQLAERDNRVKALRFRRNFGKAAALSAGFAAATGDTVFTLDADLQDDPAEIPKFLAALDAGADLVSGWKVVRCDPWHKTFPSRVFNRLVSWFTGVKLHDHNCGFKCYRRQVIDEIQLYGEFHRFTPVLADARGFRVVEVPVNHRPRKFGQSKFGWRRFTRGFLDLLTVKFLTSYRNRPQHMLGSLGLMFSFFGAVGLIDLAATWVLTRLGYHFDPIGGRPLLLFSATSLIVGIQLLSIGLLAELILARNQHEGHIYSVSDRTDQVK